MQYPLWQILVTMAALFLCILWIFLLFKVITDLFRSQDVGGWGKAGWLLFIVIFPAIGVLTYLGVRGPSMAEREMAAAARQEREVQEYVRTTARIPNQADELSKLAQLRDHGDISEAEYQRAKEKILS
ncbi:Phospholipase_D-nuclease N-terminal [Actinopolymorpha cephalotaxi]|uniref:Phospholipase_D-nuclease N-terminal n=1 Tax=Actinopolymorpha cephalotaxi TaxID=504797 RepID=A0A1I2N8U3_9ACTN|nr:SHOCT domain-containing protein [Actinopolymorpha cephalotaxi]NYH85709.1 hypothetical protein [Actinopolymorpha cephalotaxi]SFF98127.1 Phospholipase_D-nuclease N-terminal [Actinopolymorpha cephalotaxi]